MVGGGSFFLVRDISEMILNPVRESLCPFMNSYRNLLVDASEWAITIASYHVTALPHVDVNTNSFVTMMINDMTMIINDVTRMISDMTGVIVAVMSAALRGIQSNGYL